MSATPNRIEERQSTIPGAAGESVSTSLYLAPSADASEASPSEPGSPRRPLAILVPGFKGFKDWGHWPWLARRWAADGLATLTVNLSHNGVSGHGQDFTRLDLFEADTWSKRLADMTAVLAWVRSADFPAQDQVDRERLALVGHSMGGGLALLVAAEDPGIRAVVTLAGIASVHRFAPEHLEQMERNGYASFHNARTGQEMRVGRALIDEIRANPERFDLLAAARRLGDRPLLVVQGDEDPAVTVADAHALHGAAGDSSRLRILPGAGHTFGAKHPADDEPQATFPAMADEVAHFLLDVL